MTDSTQTLERLATSDYKYGFVTDIEQDSVPPGLNEDVIRLISAKKQEPAWLLEWRLQAYGLLRRAEAEGRRSQEPGRDRPGTAPHL